MSTFGTLTEHGAAECPRCYGTRADQLGPRLYRCQGRCRDAGMTAGEREFRIRADDARARARADQRVHADRVRMARRYEEWADRWTTRPRTQAHRVLRLSPETRAAWNAVRAAKRDDSFQRRGQTFLDALWRDIHDVPNGARAPLLYVKRGSKITEDRGTWRMSAPRLSLTEAPGGRLGLWSRSLTGGHRIEVARSQWTRAGWERLTHDEMRDTLVHEVQHWMDAVAGFDDEGHGRRWSRRLAELQTILPPTAAAPRRRPRRRPR